MDTLSLKHLISSVCGSFPRRWCLTSSSMHRIRQVPLQTRRAGMQNGRSRVTRWAKEFELRDFQGFARPFRLLPTREVNIGKETSLDEILTSSRADKSCSLFVVQLRTSVDYRSSLSNPNAAVLICLIDVNGDAILQRIPSTTREHPGYLKETDISGLLRFQRGCIDIIAFKGPKLGEIEAFWIGVESGSWRLGGVSLKVIDPHQSPIGSNEDGKQNQYDGLQYSFEASNILVGDGGDVSMVELRPALLMELEDDISTLLDVGLSQSTPLSDQKISPEQSMREYTDLKLSLLLYDALLIFAGTLIAVSAANEKAAQAFLVGGAGGFLYLLLLQKSVDGLSTPALSTVKRENLKQVFGGFKGPLTSLALVFALAIVIVKYGLGNVSIVLTPQELLAGAAGFLTCKVAVILAAFKPMQTSLKENK